MSEGLIEQLEGQGPMTIQQLLAFVDSHKQRDEGYRSQDVDTLMRLRGKYMDRIRKIDEAMTERQATAA